VGQKEGTIEYLLPGILAASAMSLIGSFVFAAIGLVSRACGGRDSGPSADR
jgi:hypothetical protein